MLFAERLRDRRWWLGFAPAILLLALIRGLSNTVVSDSWLDLVGGRAIAEHGIPHSNTWTLFDAGRQWIDQQWLGQWVFYHISREIGIVGLAEVVALSATVSLLVLGLSLYRLGLPALHCQIIGLALVPELVFFNIVRAQAWSVLLFVLLWVVLADLADHSRRWPLVPIILLLWGNTHGAVVIGIALVWIWAGVRAKDNWRLAHWRASQWPVLALVSTAAALLTPYGLTIFSYYHTFASDSALSKVLLEWQPPTINAIIDWPFFAFLLVSLFVIGAHWRQVPRWQLISYGLLMLGGLHAVRFDIFFSLASASLLGHIWASHHPTSRPAPIWLVPVLIGIGGWIIVNCVMLAVEPGAQFIASTPCAPQAAVAPLRQLLVRQPEAHIFVDDEGADYLLWRLPQASGHIALDTRTELLTDRQFFHEELFLEQGLYRPEFSSGYAAVVVLPFFHPGVAAQLRHWLGWHVVADQGVVVIERNRLATAIG
jgi:hypothetical protein